MRSTIVRTLVEAADSGIDVHFLTADLGFRVLDPFRERHPDRFTNVGVSEANMVSVAAGLALTGRRPVCYSMMPFLFMRAFEQVRFDVVAHQLPVVFVGVGGGLSYGHEGVSHHAIEDIAMARALPGLRLVAPADPHEAAAALRSALHSPGPTLIRLGQNNDPILHASSEIDLARPIRVRQGDPRIVVLGTGHLVATLAQACDILASRNIAATLYSVPTLKPFDPRALHELTDQAEFVITAEEHSLVGGLGSLVGECLLEQRFRGRFLKLGLTDAYCELHGALGWLRQQYGLDAAGLARNIEGFAK